MLKRYIAFIALIGLFIVTGANTSTTVQPEEWKNLKVLPKDISHEALDSVMGMWSMSLGVKCNFCHAMSADTTIKRLDFASDANDHKDVARYMHTMTIGINDKYFNYIKSTQPDTLTSVACYTCHRGKAEIHTADFIATMDSTMKARHKK